MDAREALERRIDELCCENERLRGTVESLIGRSFRTADKLDCLNAENAKLRELVRDYHTFLALADLAQPIGHIIAASGHPTLGIESLDSRCRELGIIKEA